MASVRIYKIECLTTGKLYVGQTSAKVKARWRNHLSRARTGTSAHCSALYAAVQKHGEQAFVVSEVVSGLTRAEANEAEAKWITELGSQVPGGYNLKAGGCASRVNAVTREKIAASLKGKAKSPEARSNMRKPKSPRHVANMKAAWLLRKMKADGHVSF